MNNFDRQESGCPFRLCSDDGDNCAIDKKCKDVTGFTMCDVDWESCQEYKATLETEKRFHELIEKQEPEKKAAAWARLKNKIELEGD